MGNNTMSMEIQQNEGHVFDLGMQLKRNQNWSEVGGRIKMKTKSDRSQYAYTKEDELCLQ